MCCFSSEHILCAAVGIGMQARKRTGMQLCDHQMCPEEPGFLRAPDFDDDNTSNDDELLFALLALLTNWRHSEDSLEFKLLK